MNAPNNEIEYGSRAAKGGKEHCHQTESSPRVVGNS